MRRLIVLLAPALLMLVACEPEDINTLDRKADPVVLTGAQLPTLVGAMPGDIVAFRYNRFAGGWVQIPVQVDERHTVDLKAVHNDTTSVSLDVLAYSDPSTLTGPDPTATFDADDELVFMAADGFGKVTTSEVSQPAGTVPGTGVELQVSDPLRPGAGAYVYLFRQDGSLNPAAGRDYVSYTFDLLAGDYPADYNFLGLSDPVGNPPSDPAPPANPENSSVVTSSYREHFVDRWITDQLAITARGATAVDILDRNRNHFAPGACGRSEQTFAAGHGAFVTNKDGPVRAIRDYIGANSGTYTQRRQVFYQQRQDVTTFLRVHALPEGPDDMLDLAPAATGMTYRNNLNTTGVTVDGQPDAVTPGALGWEMWTGAQGSLVVAHRTETDIALSPTSRYNDDTTPSPLPCTGDAQEWGTAGPVLAQALPNTDPTRGEASTLVSYRTNYYDAPGLTAQDAATRATWAATPLAVDVVAPWSPPDT